MDLINIEGWIPREQILGDEARSKVPPVSSQSVYMMAATLVASSQVPTKVSVTCTTDVGSWERG